MGYMDSFEDSDVSSEYQSAMPSIQSRNYSSSVNKSNFGAAVALVAVTALERCAYCTLTYNIPFTLGRWFYFEEAPMSLSNCSRPGEEKVQFDRVDTLTVVMILTTFFVLCSIFSVLGGWLGDSKLGRHKALLLSFVFYTIGSAMFLLLVYCMICNSSIPSSDIIPNLSEGSSDSDLLKHMCHSYHDTLTSLEAQLALQWILLVLSYVLISLGYGFCKPNIAPFGADQLRGSDDHLQRFYFGFYFFTNVGSLLAFGFSFMQTQEQEAIVYMESFIVPIVLSVVCFIILLLCSKWFVKNELAEDTFTIFFHILKEWLATFKVKSDVIAQTGNTRIDLLRAHNGGSFTDEEVDAFKDLWRIMPVLSTMIIYWACYSQVNTFFYFQGYYLILPQSLPLNIVYLINPAIILLLVPLLNNVIYPFMRRKGRTVHIFTRVQIGYALMGVSLFCAVTVGWLEKVYTSPVMNPKEVHYFHVEDSNMYDYITYTVRGSSIWWLLPQIFFESLSEVMAIISSMEFVYREAPAKMKSFVMGIYLLVNALGNVCAILLVLFVKFITDIPSTEGLLGGQWICNNLNDGNIYNFFSLLIFLMVINMLCFCRHSRTFTPDFSRWRFRRVNS